MVKNPPSVQEIWVQTLGWEHPLEKKRVTHSHFLAWRIPWTEEAGRLQSMESESHVTEQLTLSLFCRENSKREQITSTLTLYWHLENAPCLLDSCSALVPHDSDTKLPQALESDQGLNTGLSLNTGFIYHYHWLI